MKAGVNLHILVVHRTGHFIARFAIATDNDERNTGQYRPNLATRFLAPNRRNIT